MAKLEDNVFTTSSGNRYGTHSGKSGELQPGIYPLSGNKGTIDVNGAEFNFLKEIQKNGGLNEKLKTFGESHPRIDYQKIVNLYESGNN